MQSVNLWKLLERKILLKSFLSGCKIDWESLRWSTKWQTSMRASYTLNLKALLRFHGEKNSIVFDLQFLIIYSLLLVSSKFTFRLISLWFVQDLWVHVMIAVENWASIWTLINQILFVGRTMKHVQTPMLGWEAWSQESLKWKPKCKRLKLRTTKPCKI